MAPAVTTEGSNEVRRRNVTIRSRISISQIPLPIPIGPRNPSHPLHYIKSQRTESHFRDKIKTFPSFIQNSKSHASSGWNWETRFRTLTTREDDMRNDSLFDLYRGANQTLKNLRLIRYAFRQGIKNMTKNEIIEFLKECDISPKQRHSRNITYDGLLEYNKDAFQDALKREERYQMWTSKHLTNALDIERRNGLVNWVYKRAVDFNYLAETAHLAIYMIDAYLNCDEKVRVSTKGWKLLGIATLHIAAKLEEVDPVPVSKLLEASPLDTFHYSRENVGWMERNVLQVLRYDVYPALAPLFARMVLLGGSLDFPDKSTKILVYDLCMGILYKGTLQSQLFSVRESVKAKVALEIATEFVIYNHQLYSRRDMTRYKLLTKEPGKEIGEFAVNLCFGLYMSHFKDNSVPMTFPEFRTTGTG